MPFTKARKSDGYLNITVFLGSGQLLIARKHLKARINVWTCIFKDMTLKFMISIYDFSNFNVKKIPTAL